MNRFSKVVIFTILFIAVFSVCIASESAGSSELEDIIQVQKYVRAIHIMAMLMLGFGFLMVFVKKYGRTAVTATYMMVSIAIPTYFLLEHSGIFAHPEAPINSLILAEFSAAALLLSFCVA